MRVHFAIIFSLVCGPAMADESVKITSTAVNQTPVLPVQPVSIGHPHACTDSYPAAAIAAHAQGIATLAFTIKTDGTVKDVRVSKSSNSKDIDDASVECITHWLYKPATRNSVPVETTWQANVVWKIPEAPDVRRAAQYWKYRLDQSPL